MGFHLDYILGGSIARSVYGLLTDVKYADETRKNGERAVCHKIWGNPYYISRLGCQRLRSRFFVRSSRYKRINLRNIEIVSLFLWSSLSFEVKDRQVIRDLTMSFSHHKPAEASAPLASLSSDQPHISLFLAVSLMVFHSTFNNVVYSLIDLSYLFCPIPPHTLLLYNDFVRLKVSRSRHRGIIHDIPICSQRSHLWYSWLWT